MGDPAEALLALCRFPPAGTAVDLAVSGGPDSVGLWLLARAARLEVRVHHVDHGLRPASADDAALVEELGRRLGAPVRVHRITVAPGPNLEARARSARRGLLPAGALTGHTMDDLAETVLVNLLRGAGLDGLSPLVGDPTKPLIGLRRAALHAFVEGAGVPVAHDESNDDLRFVRNRVRHQVVPLLAAVAERDIVPLLARQAALIAEERDWLDEVAADPRALSEVDCRELASWPRARLRRWLRSHLRLDAERHPPSAAEVERAIAVVEGRARAAQLTGGRRLGRSRRHLHLGEGG